MNVEDLILTLNLKPHPEEHGFFRETYRSKHSTAIYFLITSEGMSQMHRLKSHEIYHFYKGAPAEVLLLDPDEIHTRVIRLGNDIASGEIPQIVIPANVWQGMRTLGDFTLIGCTVAPPFQYSEYEVGIRSDLIRGFPAYEELIARLTG